MMRRFFAHTDSNAARLLACATPRWSSTSTIPSTDSEKSVSPIASAESVSTPASQPAASKKPFSSTIRFSIPDGKVTAENLPSADELEKLVPTLADLRKQLPSAKEMEAKYVFGTTAAQKAAAEKANASGENKPLWPNCDTPEEIMDEERYGADGEVRQAPTSEQVALAWRALAWGTVYAIIGVGALSVIGLKACGFSSAAELKAHLAAREDREQAKLRTTAESLPNTDSSEVQHFVLDLTNPSDVPRQVQEIFDAVQRLAEKEASAEANKAASTK